MKQQLQFCTDISVPASLVWDVLTQPQYMLSWLGEPEMKIQIITDWKQGNPILINGFHHGPFLNSGRVLDYSPFNKLCYTHLSSLSKLEDLPENHTLLTFTLNERKSDISLCLTLENFPNPGIFHHLNFYWKNILPLIKKICENARFS